MSKIDNTYFYDESGSITLSNYENNRFFVIAGVSSSNENKTIRIFRKAKVKYLRDNKNLKFDIKKEIKGSEMDLDFKEFIFNELMEKTDIKFNFIIFDNKNAVYNLRSQPSLCYNYLMYIQTNKLFFKCDTLRLNLDNRNTAIESLKSLEDYLKLKYMFETQKVKNVKVKYYDSKDNELIQIADIFANFIFRLSKGVQNQVEQQRSIDILEKMKKRGVAEETLEILQYSGLDLSKWLHGFDDVAESVTHDVNMISNHPLIPKDVPVHGLVINPDNGKVDLVVNGYDNLRE